MISIIWISKLIHFVISIMCFCFVFQLILNPQPSPNKSPQLLVPPPSVNLTMVLCDWTKHMNVFVYMIVMVFAIASWIDINGLFVELPLMVDSLPEGWNLPSYLAVIIQIANIGPLLYTIAHNLWPDKIKEWPFVYVIIIIGMTACLLLAFFWDLTSVMMGVEHSTALIALASLLSLVDCTSSVVFLPYMALYKPQYMSAFYIGEGLSGFIPGIVGLIQGVGSDPNCVNTSIPIHNVTTGENYTGWNIMPVRPTPLFSVTVFFYFLFVMIFLSGVAFSLLHFLPYYQNETVAKSVYDVNVDQVSLAEANSSLISWRFVVLLSIVAWANCLTNGVLVSTQSYSNLPYSSMVYTLSVRLSTIANPLACMMTLFFQQSSIRGILLWTLSGTVLAAYQLCLAAMSPYPPLLHTITGEMLAVSTWVLVFSVALNLLMHVCVIGGGDHCFR